MSRAALRASSAHAAAAKPASPPPVQPVATNPGLREYLIGFGAMTLFLFGIMFAFGATRMGWYCATAVIALIAVLTFAREYGIPKLISYIRFGRRRDNY